MVQAVSSRAPRTRLRQTRGARRCTSSHVAGYLVCRLLRIRHALEKRRSTCSLTTHAGALNNAPPRRSPSSQRGPRSAPAREVSACELSSDARWLSQLAALARNDWEAPAAAPARARRTHRARPCRRVHERLHARAQTSRLLRGHVDAMCLGAATLCLKGSENAAT